MKIIKKLQVTWNGKRLKDVYVGASKFQVFKYRVRKFLFNAFKVSVALSVFAGAVYGSFQVGARANNTYEITVDNLPRKIEEMKAATLEKLKGCETPGYKEHDAPIILDTNKKMSIGLYQFQIDTIIHYEKALYGKTVTRKEAVMIALDEKEAAKLAEDIIFTSKNGANDWLNCSRKLGLSNDIKFVKQLEK